MRITHNVTDFVFTTSYSSIKIPALFVTIQASQVKSNHKKKISNIMSDSHLFVYLLICLITKNMNKLNTINENMTLRQNHE